MTAKTKILALVAVVAIASGIYAITGGSGNKRVAENASSQNSTTDGAAANNQDLLKPMTRGGMAAMRILDRPLDLSSISFSDGEGKALTIADWKGRTVLLNLWATWCPPCRHEMPSLEDLEKQLGGENFEVVAVSIDLKTTNKPMAFYTEIGIKELDFYWDGTAKIFNALKKQGLAFGMPTTILIDKQGMALGALNGPAEWNSPDAIALIKKAM